MPDSLPHLSLIFRTMLYAGIMSLVLQKRPKDLAKITELNQNDKNVSPSDSGSNLICFP